MEIEKHLKRLPDGYFYRVSGRPPFVSIQVRKRKWYGSRYIVQASVLNNFPDAKDNIIQAANQAYRRFEGYDHERAMSAAAATYRGDYT